MSDLARMITSVKNDLTKSISDQADALKHTVDEVVAPIVKRQDEFEEQSEKRFASLEEQSEKRYASLEAKVASLSDLIKESNSVKSSPQIQDQPQPNPSISCSTAFPPLSPPDWTGYRASGVPTAGFASCSTGPPSTPESSAVNPTISDLIADARKVIGIGPIGKSHIEYFAKDNIEEGIRLAAIEALRLELNVKEHEISDADIADTFLPKGSPKIPRVYIKFHKQEHANLCLKLAKWLTDKNIKVFRYFPRQLQDRVRALENVAYSLRKNCNPQYKTEVVYTDSDVQLTVCPKGQVRYYPYHVADLPPIDMTPLRSPPPGRPPRHTKRNRSGSSSPSNARKSVRQISPLKPDGANDIDSSITDPTAPSREVIEEINAEKTSTTPDTNPVHPGPSCPNPALDLGEYTELEVFSPTTGKQSFHFKETVNERRMSLNM